jgi:hypothetical protein
MLLFGKRQYIFYKKKINMRNYLTGKERLLVALLAFILPFSFAKAMGFKNVKIEFEK